MIELPLSMWCGQVAWGLAVLGNLSQSKENTSCIFGKITSDTLVEIVRKGWILLNIARKCEMGSSQTHFPWS